MISFMMVVVLSILWLGTLYFMLKTFNSLDARITNIEMAR